MATWPSEQQLNSAHVGLSRKISSGSGMTAQLLQTAKGGGLATMPGFPRAKLEWHREQSCTYQQIVGNTFALHVKGALTVAEPSISTTIPHGAKGRPWR